VINHANNIEELQKFVYSLCHIVGNINTANSPAPSYYAKKGSLHYVNVIMEGIEKVVGNKVFNEQYLLNFI
jgi:hypothetical protein